MDAQAPSTSPARRKNVRLAAAAVVAPVVNSAVVVAVASAIKRKLAFTREVRFVQTRLFHFWSDPHLALDLEQELGHVSAANY